MCNRPCTAVPLICDIMSPARRPASYAGPPSSTAYTHTHIRAYFNHFDIPVHAPVRRLEVAARFVAAENLRSSYNTFPMTATT